MEMDAFEGLVAAMQRAKDNEMTDDDKKKQEALTRVFNIFVESLSKEHTVNGGVLDKDECVVTAMLFLAESLKRYGEPEKIIHYVDTLMTVVSLAFPQNVKVMN